MIFLLSAAHDPISNLRQEYFPFLSLFWAQLKYFLPESKIFLFPPSNEILNDVHLYVNSLNVRFWLCSLDTQILS